MKNSFTQLAGLLILCLSIIFSSVSCTTNVYACEVITTETEECAYQNLQKSDRVILIGQSTYRVQYDSSIESWRGYDIIDVYKLSSESSDSEIQKIYVEPTKDEIVRFANINPYSKIENIDSLTDPELKTTVELMMADLVDFSRYNDFKATRPNKSDASSYHLVWRVKRELQCNIYVGVFINKDGLIKSFSKVDNCPDNLTKSFVSTSQRDKLIEKAIIKYMDIDSIDEIEYEINSETLSYYNNKPAILYMICIYKDGFPQVMTFVIY